MDNKKNGIFGDAIDYNSYEMSNLETFKGYGIGFLIATAVLTIFYRNIFIALVAGVIAGFVSIKIYNRYLIDKRKKQLLLQFKDLMESLATSYSAGKNTPQAFETAYADLLTTYGEEALIVEEVKIIVTGLFNNFTIEALLMNLAKRSGLEDIRTFADVFEVCNRQGADVKNIVDDTSMMIRDKIDIELEIKKMLNSSKMELNILIAMPCLVALIMNSDSSMSIVNNNPKNLIIKTICIAIFAVAYFAGSKIVNVTKK